MTETFAPETAFTIGEIYYERCVEEVPHSFETEIPEHSGGCRRRDTARAFMAECADDEVDPRVANVMSGTIGIDMHNHVHPAGIESNPQQWPPRRQEEQQQTPGLSMADEIKQSGLTAVCASYELDFAPNKKPGDAPENFLRWLTALDAELEKGHMRRAMNLKDLKAAHHKGQLTIVQSVEGAMFIEGRLERVEEAYNRGVRHLQLLHQRDDMVSPLGDTNTAPARLGGLTAFGAEVVKECNRLGILVDLAHASHETVLGALKVATQPVIVSHTSLNSRTGGHPRMAEMMKPRLISKEHAKVVADAGGVVGVWTKLADSLKEFVESIKAMVDAVGIDHVGIGTDTDLLSSREGQGTNKAYRGLNGGFFPAVVGEMLLQGFTPGDIGKVGGGILLPRLWQGYGWARLKRHRSHLSCHAIEFHLKLRRDQRCRRPRKRDAVSRPLASHSSG